MGRYAQSTTVSTEQSRAEIEKALARYGADQFMAGWEEDAAYIAFRAQGRMIRLYLPLPSESDFTHTPERGLRRDPEGRRKAWEQERRQRWRALLLIVKAKLEAIEAGIVTFEDEFMPHIILPDGGTVSDWMRPQIDQAYSTGLMPARLPMLPERGES